MGFLAAAILIALAAAVLWLRAALTAYAPPDEAELRPEGPAGAPIVHDAPLSVLCWNIGFAGMSAEMDFYADGGRRRRASSASRVEANYRAILERIETLNASVLLLQELADDSFATRGVDVLGKLRADLSDRAGVFSPTMRIGPLPVLGHMTFGKATFATPALARAVRRALPVGKDLPTVTVQHFNLLVTRLPVAGADWEWVLLNVHLSAFDDGDLRRRQFEETVALMRREFERGNRVVAGGDWNLLLAATDFPYSTDEKNLFWIREMPAGVVPEGWTWGVDPTVPTCRTLEQPYREGVNYTCVIDGFLATPNVEVLETRTTDTNFEHSDHQPVLAVFRSRPDGGD